MSKPPYLAFIPTREALETVLGFPLNLPYHGPGAWTCAYWDEHVERYEVRDIMGRLFRFDLADGRRLHSLSGITPRSED